MTVYFDHDESEQEYIFSDMTLSGTHDFIVIETAKMPF